MLHMKNCLLILLCTFAEDFFHIEASSQMSSFDTTFSLLLSLHLFFLCDLLPFNLFHYTLFINQSNGNVLFSVFLSENDQCKRDI